MMSCPEALRILGIWKKKQLVEIWAWRKQVDFWSQRGEISWGLRNVPHVVGSQHRKKLCLSLISKNLKPFIAAKIYNAQKGK